MTCAAIGFLLRISYEVTRGQEPAASEATPLVAVRA
jgi:hypothetical protein